MQNYTKKLSKQLMDWKNSFLITLCMSATSQLHVGAKPERAITSVCIQCHWKEMNTWKEDIAYQLGQLGKMVIKHSLAVLEKTGRLASACSEIGISFIGWSESSVIQDFFIKSVNLPLFNWNFEPEYASWDWTRNLQRTPSQTTEFPGYLHLAAQLKQSITP